MVDANQKWEVQEAIDWMKELAEYNITWIEEPTSPDDVLGHATISKVRQSCVCVQCGVKQNNTTMIYHCATRCIINFIQ